MTDREFKELRRIARKYIKQKPTKEYAMAVLQGAGILDKDGNYTPPYRALNALRKR